MSSCTVISEVVIPGNQFQFQAIYLAYHKTAINELTDTAISICVNKPIQMTNVQQRNAPNVVLFGKFTFFNDTAAWATSTLHTAVQTGRYPLPLYIFDILVFIFYSPVIQSSSRRQHKNSLNTLRAQIKTAITYSVIFKNIFFYMILSLLLTLSDRLPSYSSF